MIGIYREFIGLFVLGFVMHVFARGLQCKFFFFSFSFIRAPENIPEWAKDPIDITLVLPHEFILTTRSTTKRVYWNSSLTSTLQECLLIPSEELGDWIFIKQIMAKNLIEDAEKRTENDKKRLEWLLKEKKDFLDQTVKKLESINDKSGKKVYLNKDILIQPTYQKAISSLTTPFMDVEPWPNLYEKLKNDCDESPTHPSIVENGPYRSRNFFFKNSLASFLIR